MLLVSENGLILKYTMIIYFIPLIMFVFGIISGIIIFGKNNVSNSDIKSIGIGLIFLTISLMFLKLIDKVISKKNKDIIKAIKIL